MPRPGSASTGGSGGGSATDATTGADGSGGPSETGADFSAGDGGSSAPGPADYGGVGQRPRVLLQYTDSPVPPLVASECAEDPTVGFTEYRDGFVVQRPHNLAVADRFKYENGIYSFWVQSGDQPHQPGNTTQPRVEARYSNFTTGEHIWSADVMYETPSKTCVMQIHNTVAAIAMYLRVQGNRMFNLSTGKTILTDYEKKWFNLKVAFNTQTLEVRIFVNNCLKETSRAPRGTPNWYFKNGVYTCDGGTCRSNFKNVHLYRKGSTDTFPMPKEP